MLVDFWAPWCGPCKQLAPALEKAVADSGGKVALVKMNIDEHPQIAGQLGIQSIPAVIAFDKGQPVDGFVGALPESQIRGFIERLVGPLTGGSAALLAEAEEARRQRRRGGRGGDLRRSPGRGPGRTPKRSAASQNSRSPPDELDQAKALARDGAAAGAGQGARSGGRRGLAALRLAEQAATVGELAPLEQPSRPIRTTIRRGSTSRSRFRPRATARGRPTSCLKSSGGTASGTTRRRASNCCSCSRLGV